MSKTIAEIEKEIAEKTKELEETRLSEGKEVAGGVKVVVLNEKTEELEEISVKHRKVSKKTEGKILNHASVLGDIFNEHEEFIKEFDGTAGEWLELFYLINEPIKMILSSLLEVEYLRVRSIPNLELLSVLFSESNLLSEKAQDISKDLDFIVKKQKK